MAAKTKKTDPLSRYFEDLNEDELSNSDENDAECEDPTTSSASLKNDNAQAKCQIKNNEGFLNLKHSSSSTSNISKNDDASELQNETRKEKLPSANECLSSQNKPTFLQVLDKPELNWDTLEKRLAGEDTGSEIVDYKTNAVPPPSSYEPITDPGIKVVDKEGRKRKTSENDSSTKAYKIHKENEDE